MRFLKLVVLSMMLLTAGMISGCSNIVLHPITNNDILKIPAGTILTFPAPLNLGYGIPVTSVTRDKPGYIISVDYMERVMKVKAEEK